MKKLPPTTVMYQALIERDSTFEGIFFAAVKTTHIFCRPTCPARKPKFENVTYFSTAQEALFAGYRACLRCQPLELKPTPPLFVKELVQAIENSPAEKLRDRDLRTKGLDPSTVRRQFQKHYGMTFHAYQRARRMGLALYEVRNGEKVIDAQLNQGYESASGFWESFKKIFGHAPSQAEQVNCLFAKWIDTPLGAMLALANDKGLYLLEFVDRKGLENEILFIRKRTKCIIVPGNNIILEKITKELDSYFSGENLEFSVPLVLNGTAFEQEIWQELQAIPIGQTTTYGQLAQKVERPKAVRAVGRANGKNCLAIVVPCHRVVGADGKLTGYGGGLWRKKWMIEHEEAFG